MTGSRCDGDTVRGIGPLENFDDCEGVSAESLRPQPATVVLTSTGGSTSGVTSEDSSCVSPVTDAVGLPHNAIADRTSTFNGTCSSGTSDAGANSTIGGVSCAIDEADMPCAISMTVRRREVEAPSDAMELRSAADKPGKVRTLTGDDDCLSERPCSSTCNMLAFASADPLVTGGGMSASSAVECPKDSSDGPSVEGRMTGGSDRT